MGGGAVTALCAAVVAVMTIPVCWAYVVGRRRQRAVRRAVAYAEAERVLAQLVLGPMLAEYAERLTDPYHRRRGERGRP